MPKKSRTYAEAAKSIMTLRSSIQPLHTLRSRIIFSNPPSLTVPTLTTFIPSPRSSPFSTPKKTSPSNSTASSPFSLSRSSLPHSVYSSYSSIYTSSLTNSTSIPTSPSSSTFKSHANFYYSQIKTLHLLSKTRISNNYTPFYKSTYLTLDKLSTTIHPNLNNPSTFLPSILPSSSFPTPVTFDIITETDTDTEHLTITLPNNSASIKSSISPQLKKKKKNKKKKINPKISEELPTPTSSTTSPDKEPDNKLPSKGDDINKDTDEANTLGHLLEHLGTIPKGLYTDHTEGDGPPEAEADEYYQSCT